MIRHLRDLITRSPDKERFTAAPRPWRIGEELERECLMIFDATGRHIATVDEFLQLPEDRAKAIAEMIVNAVNGFTGSENAGE